MTRRPHLTPGRAAAVAVGLLAVALLCADGARWGKLVSEASFVVFPAAAAVSCGWRARRESGPERHAWSLFALSTLVWAGGGVAYLVLGLRTDHAQPFPSLADAGFVLYGVPAVAGLLLLLARHGRARTSSALLDSAVLMVSLLLIGGVLVLDPVVHSATGDALTTLTIVGYPLVDVTMLSLGLTIALGVANGARSWRVLVLGFVTLACVDIVYVKLVAAGAYQSGGLLDLGWAAAFALIATAPHVGGLVRPMQSRLSVGEAMLPNLALVVALGVAWVYAQGSPGAPLVVGTAALLVVLGSVRELRIVSSNIRLTRDLDARVAERTSELQAEREFLDTTLASLHTGVVACDADGRVTFANDAAAVMHDDERRRRRARWLEDLHDPVELHRLPRERWPLRRALDGEVVVDEEIAIVVPHRPQLVVTASAQALHDPQGRCVGAVMVLHDITDRKRLQDQAVARASRDELTRLGNRGQFTADVFAAASARDGGFAVLLLDLDDFKKVNDSLGHHAGDLLLLQVADRIRSVLRAGDRAARLGGDEFAVLLRHADAAVAVTVAERLLQTLEAPVEIGPTELALSASIGVATSDSSGSCDLLGAADLAMYRAKQRGKGGVAVFEPVMQQAVQERLSLEGDLRRAVRSSALHLVYQPIVDLKTGALAGVEALVRWEHATRGAVSPAEFIPLAEQTGLILPLGEWVLREAAGQVGRWNEQFPGTPLVVSVNVSTRQLERPGLLTVIDELVQDGLDPAQLVLEITETALGLDDHAAADTLQALRDRGVHLAVDDFGTGYSSLGRLRAAPVNRLKIDRSFVSEILSAASDVPIIDATMAMSVGLGLGVVAEGIETLEQLAYLQRMGCAQAQGFLLARPMGGAEISGILGGAVPWRGLVGGDRSGPAEPAELTRLYDIALSPDTDLDDLVGPVLADLQRVTGLRSAYFTRVDTAADTQRIAATAAGTDPRLAVGTCVAWSDSLCKRALERGIHRTADAPAAFPDTDIAEQAGIRTFLVEPVHDPQGGLYGTLCAAADDAVDLGEGHSATVRLFARLITEKLRATAPRSVTAPRRPSVRAERRTAARHAWERAVQRAAADAVEAAAEPAVLPRPRRDELPAATRRAQLRTAAHETVLARHEPRTDGVHVVVATADPAVLGLVASALEEVGDVTVTAHVESVEATVGTAVADQPDLLVLALGEGPDEEVVAELRRFAPATRTLLVAHGPAAHERGGRLPVDRSVRADDGVGRVREAVAALLDQVAA